MPELKIENHVLRECLMKPEEDSIVIPNGVIVINCYSFKDCVNLKSIEFPQTVTYIGDSAFEDCENLVSVTFSDGLKSIGMGTFRNCKSLTNVELPNTVTYINHYAFENCSSLESIKIPRSVTEIGDDVFADCDNLTIHCNKNSYAEQYAKENNIKYEIIKEYTVSYVVDAFVEINKPQEEAIKELDNVILGLDNLNLGLDEIEDYEVLTSNEEMTKLEVNGIIDIDVIAENKEKAVEKAKEQFDKIATVVVTSKNNCNVKINSYDTYCNPYVIEKTNCHLEHCSSYAEEYTKRNNIKYEKQKKKSDIQRD